MKDNKCETININTSDHKVFNNNFHNVIKLIMDLMKIVAILSAIFGFYSVRIS